MTDQPLLTAWRDAIAMTEATCPWPGPRPLTADDPETLLCGRDDDRVRFRQEVDSHKLIFLHGFSGIGKTSLLLRGLIPELEAAGYLVATCRDWSGTANSTKPAAFLAERVYEQLREYVTDLPSDATIFGALNEALGERVVIVLDQFEELIRDAPAFKERLFRTLGQINQQVELKVIISLRSEHVHELRDLERLAKPYSFSQYVLEEIDERHAIDVVCAGQVARADAITDEAAKLVAQRWIDERKASRKLGPMHAVGLLHLQAFLFALSDVAQGGPVTESHVDALTDVLAIGGRASGSSTRFDQALQYAVDVKLETCRRAALGQGLDILLVDGTAITVARSVTHLSSGGFKLVREAGDLVEATLEAELEKLRRGIAFARQHTDHEPDGPVSAEQFRALFDVVVGAILPPSSEEHHPIDLFAARIDLAAEADRRCAPPDGGRSWSDRLHIGASPLAADMAEVTSGPMLGSAPAAVLLEEVRRFVFALAWLQESDTVRLSSPGGGSVMVALIHDRFGVALDRWSHGDGRTALAPLYGLTAALGADFDWVDWEGDSLMYLPELDGGSLGVDGAFLTPPRVLVNLRWRGCRINANLRSVVFVNCDFKGSSFDKCRLEGVTFVNCVLDGLLISDCTVIGTPPALEGDLASDAAPYEVRRSSEAVRLLGAYGGGLDDEVAIDELALISQPPEFPAIAGTTSDRRRVLEPHNGGVTVYGGRTSSFLVRRCRFESDGTLALRETAGAGFDVVEHRYRSRFEITASRLRHISITASPTSTEHPDPVDLFVDESIIAQLWIGAGLSGRARLSNSLLIDLWNGSPDLDARVVVDEQGRSSRYHGLVGVALEGEHDPFLADERVRTLAEIDGPARVVMGRATGMDYRRHPAEQEVR